MLKKTVNYTDFDGNECTEDVYFHLGEAELVELEVKYKNGFGAYIQNIIAADNREQLIAEFKNLLLLTHGERSTDGRHFRKTPETRERFASSAAFNKLFMELVTNEDAAVTFIKGVLPRDIQRAVEQEDARTEELPPPAA